MSENTPYDGPALAMADWAGAIPTDAGNPLAVAEWAEALPADAVACLRAALMLATGPDGQERPYRAIWPYQHHPDHPCPDCRTELRSLVRKTHPHGTLMRFCRTHQVGAIAKYRNGRRVSMLCYGHADPAEWGDLIGKWHLLPAVEGKR